MAVKMALELLNGCGMIRKSEKRRLLGVEALGTKAAELGFGSSNECPDAVSLAQFRIAVISIWDVSLTEKLCYRY